MVGNGGTQPVWFARSTCIYSIRCILWLIVSLYSVITPAVSNQHVAQLGEPYTTRMTPPKTASFTFPKKSLYKITTLYKRIRTYSVSLYSPWLDLLFPPDFGGSTDTVSTVAFRIHRDRPRTRLQEGEENEDVLAIQDVINLATPIHWIWLKGFSQGKTKWPPQNQANVQ